MVWLAEFAQLVDAAAHLGQSAGDEGGRPIRERGNPTPLTQVFPGGVSIDDPDAGHVEGEQGLGEFLAEGHAWLTAHNGTARSIGLTIGSRRVVGEFDVDLVEGDASLVLPVAIVAQPDPDRRSVALRIYHSHWPLLGRHVVRSPLLARDPGVTESDVVGEYQAALAAGDAAGWVAAFEPDGCFREPAGPQFRRCGTEALQALADVFFARGGIILEHCTVTDDGVRAALEFNAVEWGGRAMPPQAGVAVYERGRTGRLAHARVYDDVDPPLD